MRDTCRVSDNPLARSHEEGELGMEAGEGKSLTAPTQDSAIESRVAKMRQREDRRRVATAAAPLHNIGAPSRCLAPGALSMVP